MPGHPDWILDNGSVSERTSHIDVRDTGMVTGCAGVFG